jgi:hypothetical protein
MDIVGVLVFCAVGRRSHAEGITISGVATTAWPFLTGTALGWAASRAWRRPTAIAPTGVVVWLSTVLVGATRLARGRWAGGPECAGVGDVGS